MVESKTFLDYISGSRVQFRPVGSVAIVLGVLCLTQMLIFYGKWYIWIKIWEERARRFRNFGVYDRSIREEDTSIAMAKIVLIIILHDLAIGSQNKMKVFGQLVSTQKAMLHFAYYFFGNFFPE